VTVGVGQGELGKVGPDVAGIGHRLSRVDSALERNPVVRPCAEMGITPTRVGGRYAQSEPILLGSGNEQPM